MDDGFVSCCRERKDGALTHGAPDSITAIHRPPFARHGARRRTPPTDVPEHEQWHVSHQLRLPATEISVSEWLSDWTGVLGAADQSGGLGSSTRVLLYRYHYSKHPSYHHRRHHFLYRPDSLFRCYYDHSFLPAQFTPPLPHSFVVFFSVGIFLLQPPSGSRG